MSDKNCPDQNYLEIFLSGEMPPREKETLESHLSGCADCRRNLVGAFVEKAEEYQTFKTPKSLTETVENLPAKAKSASFNPFAWLKTNHLQVASATVLLVCFGFAGFYFLQNRQASDVGDVLRNGAENKYSIKLLAPEDNAIIEGSFVDFEWEKIPKASSYTLIISDEKGDIVFQEQTKQTKFRFGRAYPSKKFNEQDNSFWYVQAKLIDGRLIETAPRKIIFKR